MKLPLFSSQNWLGRLFILILVVSLASCSSERPRELYPNEHFYNQRAYPDNFINKRAITLATDQVRQIKARKAATGNWNLEGPINIGGRITDLAISPSNDNHFYVATAVGGVFRTYDQGQNWEPIFDNQGKFSIGAIEIAPSNASRIYVGTGEANASATSGAFFGDGIYRTDDGGDSWQNIGLPNSNHIARIVVDPIDPDRVFAAATGVLYGTNPDRGVYRTTDGGANWDQVLYVSDSTACIDVAMNPMHPDTLYAAMWERIRYPWVRTYGGWSSGVYRSYDGGDTWELLGNGLPAPSSENGRIGLAVSHHFPNVVYASYTSNPITNEFAGLYRSNDYGDTWTEVSNGQIDDVNFTFGWYFGNVRVAPYDSNNVMVLGQRLYRTPNGGFDWNEINGMHVDHHAMEWSLNDPSLALCGNDGGLYLSQDGGNSWSHYDNLPITQFYNIEVDEQLPERIYGGTQDNNTLRTLTGSQDDWHAILGGDGFHVIVDPTNSDMIYAEYQWGNLFRSEDGGFNMDPATDGIDENDRTNWNTPVVLSPFDSDVLFYGSNKLYMSSDNALWWDPISPDLTDGQHPSGSLSYGTITAIGPSHGNLDVIYVGTDDGNVSVTFNGGGNWQSVDDQLPNRYVTQVVVDANDDQTAYVTFSGYGYLDYAPHVYKTEDGGQNWTDISGNLPNIPLNDIKIDHATGMLFVASDMGVWYSEDDGLEWTLLGEDIPTTIVANLRIHQPSNTLYAGTFGRSIYSYDLSQLSTVSVEEDLQLEVEVFPNPVVNQLSVKIETEGAEEVTLSIVDMVGRIHHSKTAFTKTGLNTIELDLETLESGQYLIRVQSDSKEYTSQFVKI